MLRGVSGLIFVTVGNATQGFRRLLDRVDALAGEGFFAGEEVLIQFGNNPDFRALNCKQEAFLQADRFAEAIKTSSIVISHAGAGTVLHALAVGRMSIVMPRRKRYGELIDDHQLELVQVLATEGRVIPAYEPEDLPHAIGQARTRIVTSLPPPPSRMIALVSQAIEDLSKQKVRPQGK
jgi:beta-1,4-N-acetylglucosaminyltransferase